tara:strand:+ start:87 stop:335 length:249 start_codon:yes stop_codon:yes gene_type:complete
MKFQPGDLVGYKRDGRPVVHETVGVVCNLVKVYETHPDYDIDCPDANQETVMVYWCFRGGRKMAYLPKYLKLLQRQEKENEA